MRFVGIETGGEVELMLRTADRRDWRVRVSARTLALLDGNPVRSADDVAGLLIRNMGPLKLAALRVIGRGGIEGDTIVLSPADLRLPMKSLAA